MVVNVSLMAINLYDSLENSLLLCAAVRVVLAMQKPEKKEGLLRELSFVSAAAVCPKGGREGWGRRRFSSALKSDFLSCS